MKVGLVPIENVSMMWPHVCGFIEKSLPENFRKEDLADLLTECMQGTRLLWVVHNEKPEIIASYTTCFRQYPMYKSLIVEYMGGSNMDEWLDDCVEIMESFAGSSECDTIEVKGRKGWERKLTKYGVEHTYSTFEKRITEERLQ